MEEEFQRVFRESTREVVEREIGEEAVRARARKTERSRARGRWGSTIWTMECSGVGVPTV